MYLKKLQLFGFKSFASKTELVFEPGVTAIVGPNGCGKSNISDSIKWVLGEQSAKELRGLKMEDIIFNGTDNTEPVNLAEVSLTFSNKNRILPVDYDEVIITRRVFRSGESEYLLNKTQVRLKDIAAILAGTGIGVSSYSVAEQGKMDRVLNARPEDRREIFEEASGITRYKAKRKEALSKLEHTENNLIRLADIINEVKRQIASIERQARKAEKYRLEFEKLKEIDVKFSLHEYNKVKEEEGSIKDNNNSLKQKEAQLSLELSVQQDELRIHRGKISSLDDKIADTRQRVSETSATIDKNDNSVGLYKENIEELARRAESLLKEIEEIEKRYASIKEKMESVEADFNLVNNEREERQGLLSETQKSLDNIISTIKECEKAASESKLAIMDTAAEQSKLKNDMNKVAASLTSISSRHRRLNIEKDNIIRERDSIEHKLSGAEAVAAEQKKVLNKALQQLSSLKDVLRQLKNNSQEKSALIEKLKQRLASASSKHELLKDLKQKKEGFSEGTRAYMEFIENNPRAKESFIGIIADMIGAKRGFAGVLESVLGEKSQIIVLKNKEAVKEATSFLNSQRKGRAWFLAADELPGVSTDKTDFKPPSVIGRLIDIIEAKDEHKPILSYILKDTYLVEDIDKDPAFRKSSAVFVAKNGNVANGIVTLGGVNSRDEYTGIIGRDAKIREFSNEVKTLNGEIALYEAEYAQMNQKLEQIQSSILTLEDTAKKEEIKLNAVESDTNKITEQRDKLRQELNLIDLELEEAGEEENSLKSQEEKLKEELSSIETEHRELELLINENQATASKELSRKEEFMVKLAELRTQMSLVNEKYNSQSATLEMLRDSLGNEEAARIERRRQLEEAGSRSSFLKSDIERLTAENSTLAAQCDVIKTDLAKLQDEKKTACLLVADIDNKTRNSQKELDELRNNISTFHININELNHKSSSIRERVQAAYKLDLDEGAVVFDGSEDWEKIKEEIGQIRERLDGMGPVNLIAIEEHKELQDRHDFLTSQQSDLLSAKESLHKAINKINRTTRKMFIDTFEQIKIAFKDYFKLLFGGGTAELLLIDQADILESGIDIVVRPPGKKLQNISLLSGGEKALTSIALLFALFKVRPTPFCILDEIDAPLDEANIDRFSGMLQEFIKSTQFIIITHNKKTISVSDVMYGITMEKSGISKIVSVKFAQGQQKKSADEEPLKKVSAPAEIKADIKETQDISSV